MSLKDQIISTKGQAKTSLLLPLLLFLSISVKAQKDTLGIWDIPSNFHPGRYWTAAGVSLVGYSGTLISLNELWYKQYPRTSFHFFNDAEEWLQMDKGGHLFTAYFEADWIHGAVEWTGVKRSPSIWAGALAAVGLQATLETFDGFSSKWGFSLSDFATNIVGAGMWASQEFAWDEQRIRMKVSSSYRTYPDEIVQGFPSGSTTLRTRTNDLYGKNILQSFLKDYNAQTVWFSVNIHSFLKEENRFPKWLNVAFGYGAENMFGGFENEWEVDDIKYVLPESKYPRYRQLYISPDIDLSKIKIKSKPLKTLLCMANIFKIPAPALEINGKGGVKWKWLHY
ncbi:MAG TPA: DUF2279 domain-containing protein [Saprospiraceae bacterium]|nr:DUF2279 domain-containing protein [Saprospiraceae bacterium]